MDDETTRNLKAGWLGRLPSPVAQAFLEAGKVQRLPDGAIIYGLGQEQFCLFGIASGHVRMWITMNEQEPRLAHVAGPGFWFGESEVVTGQPRIMEMEASGETIFAWLHAVISIRLPRSMPMRGHLLPCWPS